ncbi:MAG: HD domain-containing phosphohydrolase [Pseudomonadota bacterium]|nr:HD domain-containing phosphohydrolase [Pseudomonadota bacterium]
MTQSGDPVQAVDPVLGEGRRRMRRRAFWAFGMLVGATALAVLAIIVHAGNERERLRSDWETSLGLVADSRAAAIGGWLGERRTELARLAGNRTMQYLLVDLADPDLPREALEERRRYVERVLDDEAERGGYAGATSALSQNSGRTGSVSGGLAVLDAEGRPVALGTAMPFPSEDLVRPLLADARPGRIALSPVFAAADGRPMIALLAPVLAPEAVDARPIGHLLGLRPLDPGFFDLLHQPGDVAPSAETYLVDRAGDSVRVLSPLRDGTSPLERQYPATQVRNAAVALATGAAATDGLVDAAGRPVLAVSRSVEGTNWTLVRQIGRTAALAEGESRIRILQVVLLLGVLLVAAAIVAVWRKAVSDKLAGAAQDLQAALSESRRLGALLTNVADAVPGAIVAVDRGDRVTFGNREIFAAIGIEPDDALGKSLDGLFGPGLARPLVDANRRVRETGKAVQEIDDTGSDASRKVLRRDHIPLGAGAVLTVSQDLTEIVTERERRAKQLDALVGVLVSVIDNRDAYAAHHSERVARLSEQVARQLGLDRVQVEAATTAARLMNLGKITIDPSILTKSTGLTLEELEQVRGSIQRSADLVSGIPFEGPVVETLRQLQENHDGSGQPKGLAGDAILPTAQVVAIANAYVALTSDRAHRAARTSLEALELLWKDAGTKFARQVVAALVMAVETQGRDTGG